ncbi:MAG: hypothetical protein ABH840_03770 [Nanoarchaeota archaeon]
MRRVKFRKGEQRKFVRKVLDSLYSPSLRALNQYGVNVNYQSLKSYYNENRTLPESLFLDLCKLARINPKELKIEILEKNWGQVRGGKR